jgi:hypothetical protein
VRQPAQRGDHHQHFGAGSLDAAPGGIAVSACDINGGRGCGFPQSEQLAQFRGRDPRLHCVEQWHKMLLQLQIGIGVVSCQRVLTLTVGSLVTNRSGSPIGLADRLYRLQRG